MGNVKTALYALGASIVAIGAIIASLVIAPILIGIGITLVIYVALRVLNTDVDD